MPRRYGFIVHTIYDIRLELRRKEYVWSVIRIKYSHFVFRCFVLRHKGWVKKVSHMPTFVNIFAKY